MNEACREIASAGKPRNSSEETTKYSIFCKFLVDDLKC